MRGYSASSYGDGFADVYDQWYAEVSDVEATVAAIRRLHPTGRLLELGVGTGRLAIPLTRTGFAVDGIDASPAMLERLRANDPDGSVRAHLGDMVTDAPAGPYEVILIAFNTIFNLAEAAAQRALCAAVAERLAPEGSFIVEAYVPDPPEDPGDASQDRAVGRPRSEVSLRSMTVDQVVLSVTHQDRVSGRVEGQFIEISEARGVRLRPWSIRPLPVGELDAMAAEAGLVLVDRWEDFGGGEFTARSDRHVSIYRLS